MMHKKVKNVNTGRLSIRAVTVSKLSLRNCTGAVGRVGVVVKSIANSAAVLRRRFGRAWNWATYAKFVLTRVSRD